MCTHQCLVPSSRNRTCKRSPPKHTALLVALSTGGTPTACTSPRNLCSTVQGCGRCALHHATALVLSLVRNNGRTLLPTPQEDPAPSSELIYPLRVSTWEQIGTYKWSRQVSTSGSTHLGGGQGQPLQALPMCSTPETTHGSHPQYARTRCCPIFTLTESAQDRQTYNSVDGSSERLTSWCMGPLQAHTSAFVFPLGGGGLGTRPWCWVLGGGGGVRHKVDTRGTTTSTISSQGRLQLTDKRCDRNSGRLTLL